MRTVISVDPSDYRLKIHKNQMNRQMESSLSGGLSDYEAKKIKNQINCQISGHISVTSSDYYLIGIEKNNKIE